MAANDDAAILRAAGPPGLAELFARRGGDGPPLRVGIALDEPCCALAAAVLGDLSRAEFVQLDAVISVPALADAPPLVDVWDSEHTSATSLIELFERTRESVGSLAMNPSRAAESPELLSLESIRHAIGVDAHGQLLANDSARARIAQLDVLVWCARRRPFDDGFFAAKFGCWYLAAGRHVGEGDDRSRIFEVPTGSTETEVLLLARGRAAESPTALCSAVLRRWPTIRRADSTPELSWEGRHFVLRALSELHANGWNSLRSRAMLQAIPPEPAPRLSSLAVAGRFSKSVTVRIARRMIPSRPRIDQWRISLRAAGATSLSQSTQPSWEGGRVLDVSRGHFWADPFLIEHGGRTYLFVEDYLYAEKRGVISVCEIDASGEVSPAVECLRLDQHLSYPHVFAHDGEFFLIPETAARGTVELYRAIDFPYRWKLEKVLFRGMAVDTTFLHKDGHCYFFTSMSDFGNQFPLQLLFIADTITSEWRLHPASPISSGVHAERGAGAILRAGNQLIRPIQDNSRGYGHSLAFAEINELDPMRYSHTVRATLAPRWAKLMHGTHTYARSSRWEAIDGLWRVDSRSVV